MILPTVPDPPTDLTEITASTTSTSVTFSWIAPANDGGLAIIGYQIWLFLYGDWQIIEEFYTDTSYTTIGMNAGTNYSFKVAAKNSFGTS